MSETSTSTSVVIDPAAWERVLASLRSDGFTPAESIKITRVVLRVPLGEAKRIVHESHAWADARDGFDEVHDAAVTAVEQL
jgi:hypothetical protein